ncbi:pyridoxamine 5'-phosphate oxidase family protein [Brucella pseudogrignonensis]|uniref:pyridoxamine 5'-phosphate oxidase family protein n=1 Tax=Brucella pseudogrignonensis TaxID=419475 RepID=UPI0038B5A066
MNSYVSTLQELESLYDAVSKPSLIKETDYIHDVYKPYIQAASLVVMATAATNGLDASPRGDAAGFVHIQNSKTILLPDRRGNNRIDSLLNIVQDPRVGLLFFIPGVNETLRVNGAARICIDNAVLEQFSVNGQLPRTVIEIAVEAVYFKCGRALIRSGLWDPERYAGKGELPTVGQILKEITSSDFDGEPYDRELPERLLKTLY